MSVSPPCVWSTDQDPSRAASEKKMVGGDTEGAADVHCALFPANLQRWHYSCDGRAARSYKRQQHWRTHPDDGDAHRCRAVLNRASDEGECEREAQPGFRQSVAGTAVLTTSVYGSPCCSKYIAASPVLSFFI